MSSDNETCSVCDAPLRDLDFAGMWVCTVCTETVIDDDGKEIQLAAIRYTRAQCKRFVQLVTQVGVFKEKTVIELDPGRTKGDDE